MLMKMLKTVRNVGGATSLLMLLAVGSAGAQTTLDPAAKGAKVTLTTLPWETTSNLVAYKTDTSATWDSALATTNVSAGKYYVEWTYLLPVNNSYVIFGLCNSSQVLTGSFPGSSSSTGSGFQTNGSVQSVGGTSGWSGASSTGQSTTVGMAFDVGAKKIWVRVNTQSSSNSWSAGDPVAGTLGGTWTFSGNVYPCIGLFGGASLALPTGTSAYGSLIYFNSGVHAFRDAAPTGYSAYGIASTFTQNATHTFAPTAPWNSPSVTLSAANLREALGAVGFGLAYPAAATHGIFPSTGSNVNGGKIYAEFLINAIGTGDPSFGIDTGLTSQYNNTSSDCCGAHWKFNASSNNFFYLGVSNFAAGTLTTADRGRIAINPDLGKLWVAKNCGGSWLPSGDPTTGTGGLDITSLLSRLNGAANLVVNNGASLDTTATFDVPFVCTNPFTSGNKFLPILGAGQ